MNISCGVEQLVARDAHNVQVRGSNPLPAILEDNMHETGRKGDIGVTAITADLLEKGLQVLLPVASTSPFDLVVTDGQIFWRVQVKYISAKKNCIFACFRRRVVSNRHIKARALTLDDVDIGAIYCPQTRQCYYLPIQQSITLRFDLPKNGIRKTIHLAKDFTIFPPKL